MSDSANDSNKNSSQTYHPHYFTTFQNFCCGPRSKAANPSTSRDLLPIPLKIKDKASTIVNEVNKTQKDHMRDLTKSTSRIPYRIFETTTTNSTDYSRYLIDRSMFRTMNDAQTINWVPSFKKLYPIRTSGNGNCLLHAVLIAMTGTHDFDLLLRDRLVQYMKRENDRLKEVWKTERLRTDKMYGIESEDPKLDDEWEEIRNLARFDNTEDGQAATSLQFLEGVHVFTISNMLVRPIIVLSEDVVRNKHGEAISYNDLYGIYLPTFTHPNNCHRQPLVIGYDQSHFCPLLTTDADTGALRDNYLPLHQSVESARTNTLLPVRFPGREMSSDKTQRVLENYLQIRIFAHFPPDTHEKIPITCVELGDQFLFTRYNFFQLYYDYVQDFAMTVKKQKEESDLINGKRQQPRISEDEVSNEIISNENNHSRINDRVNNDSPPPPYPGHEVRFTPVLERSASYRQAVEGGMGDILTGSPNIVRPPPPVTQERTSTSKTSQQNGTNHNGPLPSHPPPLEVNVAHNQRSDWSSPLASNGTVSSTEDTSTNKNNLTPRSSESKLKQVSQQFATDLYVNNQPRRVPSSNANLIDFDKRTDRIRNCLVCKQNFDDVLSIALCPKCDYDLKHPKQQQQPNPMIPMHRPALTAPAIAPLPAYPNISYQRSDFLHPTPSPTRPQLSVVRIAVNKQILCPHCRMINTVLYANPSILHTCSRCGHYIKSSFY